MKLEYTIKEMYEQNGQLRVIVDHKYGVDNLGLGLHTKKLDPETDKPRYLMEINELLVKKYGVKNKKKMHIKTYVGKKFDTGG
jgi:hypothetical protein